MESVVYRLMLLAGQTMVPKLETQDERNLLYFGCWTSVLHTDERSGFLLWSHGLIKAQRASLISQL